MPSAETRVALALVLVWVAIYTILGSRERPWGDAQVMWEVADAIVRHGRVDIAFEWPPMSHRGPDGRVYSQYAVLPSLVQVPGAAFLHAVAGRDPSLQTLWWPLACHLAPALSAALAVALAFRLVRAHLRVGVAPALACACVLGGATGLFVYARYAYSEALQAACFAWVSLACLRALADPRPRRVLELGVAAGVLVNAKLVLGLALPGAAVLVLWRARHDVRLLSLRAGVGLLGAAPGLALALFYNDLRWGSAFATGYEATLESTAGEPLFAGMWGLVLSPGKSVLLYNPPLVLAGFGLAAAWRRNPDVVRVIAACALPPLVYYATRVNWSGGWCWGPRYWVFALPLLVAPAALVFERALDRRRPRGERAVLAIACATIVGIGTIVQLLGSAFYWDHWIRVARQVRTEWLGEPDRAGSRIPTRGRNHCDSCFEDMYHVLWLPVFSPIAGHVWLFDHVTAGHDWRTAEADAPWHRYTSLPLDIERTYRRARLDAWWLVWTVDTPRHARLGWATFAVFVGLGALGGIALTRSARTLAARERSRDIEDVH